MKTKTVVLSALLGLAGIASVSAQTVYSLNTVGYVNVVFPAAKLVLFANPLDTVNTLSNLFPTLNDNDAGATIYAYDSVAKRYQIYVYQGSSSGGWMDDSGSFDRNNVTMPPGKGAFFVAQNTFTNTFVGNVLQGTQTNTVYGGNVTLGSLTMVGSQVPQATDVTTMNLTGSLADGDTIYRYNGSAYKSFTWSLGDGVYYDDNGNANTPVINVGEGFWIQSYNAANQPWVRTFNVQ